MPIGQSESGLRMVARLSFQGCLACCGLGGKIFSPPKGLLCRNLVTMNDAGFGQEPFAVAEYDLAVQLQRG